MTAKDTYLQCELKQEGRVLPHANRNTECSAALCMSGNDSRGAESIDLGLHINFIE